MTASLHPDRLAEIRHFHLFCGLGGGAHGFNLGHARVGHLVAAFRCIGGVDSSAAAVRDFSRMVGVLGTTLDLFSHEQYRAFHGKLPPAGWREATPDDIRAAAGGERPHIVFTSPPCKGFSGLLNETRSKSAQYQALNRLTIRGVRLALEAWESDPPEFFLLENVPRIATRGRPLVDEIVELLESRGYAAAETTHDCGELGNLAQSRKRFLLVARHREKVPPFLYEPERRPLRGVGEVLGRLPLPDDPISGPMHRMRLLEWKTWVRLAFVEAGGDWRSLQRLRVIDGMLADYGIAPEVDWYRGGFGVTPWEEPSATVTGGGRPAQGRFSVADPRLFGWGVYSQYGVMGWDDPSGTLNGQSDPGGGRFAVADPRCAWHPAASRNKLKVTPWDAPVGTVISSPRPDGGAASVADPRVPADARYFPGIYGVTDWNASAPTVTGEGSPNTGRFAVADPRLGNASPAYNNIFRIVQWDRAASAVTGPGGGGTGLAVADPRAAGWGGRGKYRVSAFNEPAGAVIGASTTGNGAFAVADPRASNYGVIPWDSPSGAITGAASADSGRFSVADPRPPETCAIRQTEPSDCHLPAVDARLVAVIRSLDGTWHRPFTTMELAALQGLIVPGEPLELDGVSDSAWRERIGNAVPSPAAAAIASVMGRALLLAWAGETFVLSATPIWVRPIVVAVSVDVPRLELR